MGSKKFAQLSDSGDPMDCSPPGGVGSHCLLQQIFLTQGSNPGLLYFRKMLYNLSYQRITYLMNKLC